MRVELRDGSRRHIGSVRIDPSTRPTRVRVQSGPKRPTETDDGGENQQPARGKKRKRRRSDSGPQTVFLNWDSAVDDSGQLRRCISCGCTDLYRVKTFPQITWFVVVAAFSGAIIGVLGLATPPMIAAMVLVLIADIAILLFSRERLVCYRCRSEYHDLAIAGYHRRWDRAIAERYPEPQAEEQPGPAVEVPSQTSQHAGVVGSRKNEPARF